MYLTRYHGTSVVNDRGRMTQICISKLTRPYLSQIMACPWLTPGYQLNQLWHITNQTQLREISIKIHQFLQLNLNFKMSSVYWWLHCVKDKEVYSLKYLSMKQLVCLVQYAWFWYTFLWLSLNKNNAYSLFSSIHWDMYIQLNMNEIICQWWMIINDNWYYRTFDNDYRW